MFCSTSLGEEEKGGQPGLLSFEKVLYRYRSTWERSPSHSDGYLLKRVNRIAKCHSQLNSWPVENFLGLCRRNLGKGL